MKINGFLKDVTGANRVTSARRKLIADASAENLYSDPIRELCEELHPASTLVRVTRVEDASPTARTFTFEAADGKPLPPFQAGQYVSFDLAIGETLTTTIRVVSEAFSLTAIEARVCVGREILATARIKTALHDTPN